MSLFVLDASVFVSWISISQQTEAASRLLTESGAHRFLVPQIFHVEIRNALLAAERREKWRIAETEEALELLATLDMMTIDLSHETSLDEVLRLGRAERLTMYDASYLLLAIKNYAALASRDKALLAAGRRRGVDIYDAGHGV